MDTREVKESATGSAIYRPTSWDTKTQGIIYIDFAPIDIEEIKVFKIDLFPDVLIMGIIEGRVVMLDLLRWDFSPIVNGEATR